jgi:hypothetical protein
MPWYTLRGDDFANDFGVAEYFDVNVFLPDGDGFFRTHSVNGRTPDASFSTVQQVTGAVARAAPMIWKVMNTGTNAA